MKNEKTLTLHWQLLLAAALVLVAVLGRLLPHPPNATPIAGAALLAGAWMTRRSWALLVPCAAMLLSDAVIGGYGMGVMLAVYAGLALPVLLGRYVPRGAGRYPAVAGLSLAGAVGFFVVSNLGVFLFTPSYPKTPLGLSGCFAAAVPFFKYTMLGDLAWSLAFFVTLDTVVRLARAASAKGVAVPVSA